MRTRLYRERTGELKKRWYELIDWDRDAYVNPLDRYFWHYILVRIYYPIWRFFYKAGIITKEDGDSTFNSEIVPLGELPKYRRPRTKS